MIAVMDLVTAILACGVGFIAGIMVARKKRHRTVAVCGCTHERSFHDPHTLRCHGKVNGEPIKFDIDRYPTAWTDAQCTCRRFDGPERPEDIIAGFRS